MNKTYAGTRLRGLSGEGHIKHDHCLWPTVLLVFLAVAPCCVASPADPMKAIFLLWSYENSYDAANGPDAFSLYDKMGYNTVIEVINPAGATWNTTSTTDWNLISCPNYPGTHPSGGASRAELVDYIHDRKAAAKAMGIAYCPYFNGWGWGWPVLDAGLPDRLRQRAVASVYREVDYNPPYPLDVYSQFYNGTTPTSWGDPDNTNTLGTSQWNKSTEAKIKVSVSRQTQAVNRWILMDPAGPVVPGQCYRLRCNVSFANLLPGDQVRVAVVREFAAGKKPTDPNVPMSSRVSQVNDFHLAAQRNLVISAINPAGGYDIHNELGEDLASGVANMAIELLYWTDGRFPYGPTAADYRFDNMLGWEFVLTTGPAARLPIASQVTFNQFVLEKVDPLSQLAYGTWEADASCYGAYRSLYPTEDKIITWVTYQTPKGPVDKRWFLDKRLTSPISRVRGHFLCTGESPGGYVSLRRPLDPASPVYDMVTKEMLDIIKEGLKEGAVYEKPKYYLVCYDEVFSCYRGDAIARYNAKGDALNKLNNTQFFSEMLKREIDRYNHAFRNVLGTSEIVFWADMLLPFAEAFTFFAESWADVSGFTYLRQAGLRSVLPNIWAYEYMYDPQAPSNLLLENSAHMQDMITHATNEGFHFTACYATDGTLSQIQERKPSVLSDDNHIQHEIDMARSWCDLTQNAANAGFFDGYVYCGWNSDLRRNAWDGLYSLAYFGWYSTKARDLPSSWKTISPVRDELDQPVLQLLRDNAWPPKP